MAARPGEDDGTVKRLREVLKRLRDTAPLVDTDPEAFRAGVEDIAERLREITGSAGEVELSISTNRISHGEDEVFKSEARTNNLAFDIFRQGLRRLTFKPGLTADEVHAFVVAFSENRSADQIDEDFVSTLWRESLPNIGYIAIDGFTEKIFMSEERFLGAFRGVIDDVMPGLVGLADEDPGDQGPRPRHTVDSAAAADTADLEQRKLRKALPSLADEVIAGIRDDGELIPIAERCLALVARLALKHPSPLPDGDLHRVVVRLLAAWLEHGEWQRFADGARSLRALVEQAERFPGPVAARLGGLRATIAGPDLVAHVAHHIDPEQTDFTAWARWHFATASALAAPDLLELIDACHNPAGVAFLKDLLRRQGTESLDPWAERLRDPNPGVVLEVIEVIVGSDLQAQARPLLMDTMKHPAPEVRAAAAEGLAGAYDVAVREALLPFLKDPSPVVRQAVVTRFLAAGDRSVSPYLASTIRSPMFPGFDEDEQRLYFETLARLGGARFVDVFEHALGLEEDSGGDLLSRFFKRGPSALIDTPTRRGAVSGLGILGSREAIALIRKVHTRADLGLAAHCDIVLRLAARGEAAGEAPADLAPSKARPLEDVAVGEGLLGGRTLFEVERLAGPGPRVPRPAGAPVESAPGDPAAGAAVEASPAARIAPSGAPSAAPAPVEPTITSGPAAPRQPLGPPALGDRPLLSETERYLPTDEMVLEVDASAFDGPLALFDVAARLTGFEAPAARRRPITRGPAPARIIEKTAGGAPHHSDYTDWSHKPGARLDDILADYLGQAVASAEPAARDAARPAPDPMRRLPPAGPSSADDIRALLDLDATTHHEIEAHPSAGPSPRPPEPRVAADADPSIVSPSAGGDGRESVEALLKDFLALEVSDETASLDEALGGDSMERALDRAPDLAESEPPVEAAPEVDAAPDGAAEGPRAVFEMPPADEPATPEPEVDFAAPDLAPPTGDGSGYDEPDFDAPDWGASSGDSGVWPAFQAPEDTGAPAHVAPSEPAPVTEPPSAAPARRPGPPPIPEAARAGRPGPPPIPPARPASPAGPADEQPAAERPADKTKAVEDLLKDFLAFDPEG